VFRPYERSAFYYDSFYHKLIDYRAECDILERIFRKHGESEVQSIPDVGCGTGNHDFILAKRGYNVTGVDRSENMIKVARKKAGGRSNPVFHRMDMRHVTINGKFDAAFLLVGALEYLLRDSDVRAFFRSTRRLLRGLFVFEFSQQYSTTGHWWSRIRDRTAKHVLVRLDTTQARHRDFLKANFHWYVMNYDETEILDRFSETHLLRRYGVAEIRRFLAGNGFVPLAFYDMKLKPASSSSFRVICVAKPS